jgi:hypothetical protein
VSPGDRIIVLMPAGALVTVTTSIDTGWSAELARLLTDERFAEKYASDDHVQRRTEIWPSCLVVCTVHKETANKHDSFRRSLLIVTNDFESLYNKPPSVRVFSTVSN